MYFHYALVVTLPASNYIHGERYVAKSRPFRNSKSDVKEKIEELATTFEPSPKIMKAPRSYSPVVSTSLHPTKFPSKLPTKVPSKQPTNYPTQIPSIQVVSCYDVPGWHDSDGEKVFELFLRVISVLVLFICKFCSLDAPGMKKMLR